ncbi:glutamate--cysteine ligase [Halanaerocella petrolearia]
MEYIELLDQLEEYFRAGEKDGEERIGVEIEHFVVDQNTLQTITYQEEDGIEDLLAQLQDKGWQGEKEDGHLVRLFSDQADITLEPGGQLEIGIYPCGKINCLEEVYQQFLQDVIPVLEEHNYYLLTLGYQVESKIDEIDWNPKKRYKIMSDYFEQKGQYAHNMMKGTAAFQIALDYQNEEDFVNKFRVASALSPIFSVLLDNSPIFEGEIYKDHALRTLIWNNTDQTRTGIVNKAFADEFDYRKYAEYILTREPILIKDGESYKATSTKTNREIFAKKDFNQDKLEHILTMVFPDVRAKQFIEIRMADSLPPELSFALVAFWKGLFYNQSNLEKVVELIVKFSLADILQAKEEIIEQGLKTKVGDYSILEIAKQIVNWSKEGLSENEIEYLKPLENLISNKKTPASNLKERLKSMSKKEAIRDSILNYKVDI